MSEYHNPQHDPGSERRLLFAFFLVFILIAVMQFFLPKPQQPAKPSSTPTPQAQQQQPQQPQQAGEQAQATASPTPARSGRKTTASKPVAPAVTKQAANETETVFENDYYKITFTNHGAVAKSWLLKKYTDEKGNTLDLINQPGAAAMGYPLSLFSYDKDLQKTLNSAMYVASGTGKQDEVTFEYSQGGVYARKTFRTDVGYIIRIETEVENQGQRVSVFPQWPGGLGDQVTPSAYAAGKIGWHRDGEIERRSATSGWFLTGKKWIAGGQTITGPFQWAALADQYFAMAMMPESPKDTNLVTFHEQIEIPRDPSKPNESPKDKVPLLGIAIGDVSGLTRQRIFAGPKAVDLLESTKAQPNGPDLRGILDFGTFGFIARPLFLWLKWTYEHWIPNWGWAISFLTLVITMALLPLRISAQKSQLKMQKIQPQMKAIQEKYKRYSITDPRRSDMQKEMSELYKREGVNPVGGCFPMLLQMPFLFAFYSMLGNAIELRHASWLWIRDLSAPDPFHILPILIVITMFITQKSMPQAGMDPAQQKMMNVMGPLMIGGISWGVAAGLCVYWAISNLLGYIQQTLINRSELGQQVRKTVERRATRKR